MIRRCNCIPTTVLPGEVAVVSAEGPERVPAGQVARFEVAVRNDSPRPLSDNVHLSYHWIRADGTMADWAGERAHTGGWPRGTATTAELHVPITVPPGEYEIEFELVDENVQWLEALGVGTARRRIVVKTRRRGLTRTRAGLRRRLRGLGQRLRAQTSIESRVSM